MLRWFILVALIAACTELRSAAVDGPENAPRASGESESPPSASESDGAAPSGEGVDASACATCSDASCGDACAPSCGPCANTETCVVAEGRASCAPATIIWELDGQTVARYASFEATYTPSTSKYWVSFPWWGRNVSLFFDQDAGTGTIASCSGGRGHTMTFNTLDNSYALLGALPSRWKGLVFVGCGVQSSGDVVTALDATLTHVSPARIAGTYEVIVVGHGAREGSTLRVRGVFDVTPSQP